uniref:Cyclin F n=1 Tax=Eptatretus burgeri TaxID=7764 RepID=A0A8C4WWU4_EPTBU
MIGGCLKGQSLHNSVIDMDSLDLQHSASILYLPDDMLLYILRYLPAPTLLAFQNVNTRFRHLVRHHPSIWASISFADLWPSPNQFSLFQRASKNGNFEASLKLALAFLYNEGLSLEEESRPELNGTWATAYLLRAERQATSGTSTPFSWLFIRPPWSPGGGCCKAFVFRCLQSGSQSDGVNSTIVLFCLAKVLGFLDSEVRKYDKVWALEKAAANGLIPAALLNLERQCSARHGDPGRSLHYLRKLRELSASGCWEAQLSLAQALARAYGDGRLSQSDVSAARLSVSHFFQASQPTRADQVFSAQHGMNETMRYILVDWLAEVVTTKELPSSCLHSSVRCLDSCLLQRAVSRSLLQLLGIACLVITSRMLSQDIVTVREGVWLTDNTYKYEDLVRMMGEVVSMLRGKVNDADCSRLHFNSPVSRTLWRAHRSTALVYLRTLPAFCSSCCYASRTSRCVGLFAFSYPAPARALAFGSC